MSKYLSITELATDKEIHQLWEIVGKILDRNNIYFFYWWDYGRSVDELIVRVGQPLGIKYNSSKLHAIDREGLVDSVGVMNE